MTGGPDTATQIWFGRTDGIAELQVQLHVAHPHRHLDAPQTRQLADIVADARQHRRARQRVRNVAPQAAVPCSVVLSPNFTGERSIGCGTSRVDLGIGDYTLRVEMINERVDDTYNMTVRVR